MNETAFLSKKVSRIRRDVEVMRETMVHNAEVYNNFSSKVNRELKDLKKCRRRQTKWNFIVLGLLLEDIHFRWKCHQIMEQKMKKMKENEENSEETSENS